MADSASAATTSLGELLALVLGARGVQSAADVSVLMSLVAHAQWNTGGEAWPSLATIAAKSRVSKSTAQRCIRRFLGENYLVVQTPASRRRPVTYAFNLARLRLVQTAPEEGSHSDHGGQGDYGGQGDHGGHRRVVGGHGDVVGGHLRPLRVVTVTTKPSLDLSREPSHANTARAREIPERGSGRKTRSGHPSKWFSFAEVTAEMLERLPDRDLWQHLHMRCHSDYRKADERFAAIRGYDFQRPRRARP
jgi:hypothetical protein